MILIGVVLSLCCAVDNSLIDALRKHASKQKVFTSTSLVCCVAVLDAGISCGVAYLNGGFRDVRFHDPHTFTAAVLSSAALLLFSKFLYQSSLALSPLSLTIPYLSFTAIFLVGTAYVFVGEEISRLGLVGICVITAAGYLLSRQGSAAGSSSQLGTVGSSGSLALLASGSLRGSGKQKSFSLLPAPWGSLDPAHQAVNGQEHHIVLLPPGAEQQHDSDTRRTSYDAGKREPSFDRPSFGSTMAPYHVAVWGNKAGNSSLATSTSITSGNTSSTVAARTAHRAAAAAGAADTGNPQLLPAPLILPQSGSVLQGVNVPLAHQTSRGQLLDQQTSSKLAAPGRAGSPSKDGVGRRAVISKPWESGSAMMVAVAAIWSCTAALDKLGVLHSPNVWVYFALQRLVIGCASAVYLAMHAPSAFKLLVSKHLRLLLLISVCEMLAVVLFLEAIRYLFVSYVVAIKRCNILLSVLAGGLLFNEPILSRLPYVVLMLVGMCLIVLDPDASTVHTSSHS